MLFIVPILTCVLLCFVIKRFSCHNYDKGPLKRGCLKSLVDWTLTSGSWLAMRVVGVTVTINH
jgi:hypothetical protein